MIVDVLQKIWIEENLVLKQFGTECSVFQSAFNSYKRKVSKYKTVSMVISGGLTSVVHPLSISVNPYGILKTYVYNEYSILILSTHHLESKSVPRLPLILHAL